MGHLRKHWQMWVKTYFNQPARKYRRRQARIKKATAIFPRPIKTLRSAVICPTQRYNTRLRSGKGFTLEELNQAKISATFARTIGIAVDHRRTNRSTESLQRNVARLKAYKEKLVLLPKNAKAPKKGTCGKLSDTVDADAAQTQTRIQEVLPVTQDAKRQKPMKITAEMKAFNAHREWKQEWSNAKNYGKRQSRLKQTEEN